MSDIQASFKEHLNGLFQSLKPVLILFVFLFIGFFYFSESLLEIFSQDYGIDVYVLHPYEVIITRLKISAYLSLLISLPAIFIQLVRFFEPAFREKEYDMLLKTFISVLLLSVVGGFLSFYFGLEIIINILQQFATDVEFTNAWSISNIIDFLLRMSAVIAIISNVPVMVYGVVRSGVMTVKDIEKHNKKIFFMFVLISGLITPPDIITLIIIALILHSLFLVSLKVTDYLMNEK